MQELEKILKEIDAHAIEFETFGVSDDYISVEWVKEIIRKHMNDNNLCGECSRRKWYQIGYKDGKDDGWIPVEERLPDNNEIVLVTTDMGLITSGYIAHGTWITDQEPDYPIAWRPLPEPYRPERRDNHDVE
ncbi:hypothetical protein B5F37_11670 [Drancourtella sp. An210]|nr:hypothetical protein B5F37_11670 [Drancourtella sp. An210]